MKITNLKSTFDSMIKRARRASVRATGFSLQRCTAWVLIFVLAWLVLTPSIGAGRTIDRPRNPEKGASHSSASQATETVVVYGPRRFTRASGAPTNVVEQFSLPAGIVAAFTVDVQNGAANGSNRSSSATIRLNGMDLYRPQDFNQNVASLSKAVVLSASNTLEVRLASSPGSYLTITFTGKPAASTPGTLTSVTPARATQGHTLSVTLHGENTHWMAGQTRASLGGEVSVGGAASGELGPVTVIDASTAIADVTISPQAALDPRTARVVAQTGGVDESVALSNAFVVAAAVVPGSAASQVSTIAGAAG